MHQKRRGQYTCNVPTHARAPTHHNPCRFAFLIRGPTCEYAYTVPVFLPVGLRRSNRSYLNTSSRSHRDFALNHWQDPRLRADLTGRYPKRDHAPLAAGEFVGGTPGGAIYVDFPPKFLETHQQGMYVDKTCFVAAVFRGGFIIHRANFASVGGSAQGMEFFGGRPRFGSRPYVALYMYSI